MVKWRRAPASRDGTHPLGPRALELRATARPPRGDRAAARSAGARPGRGAEAVRRGRRAAPRGTRAADRRRGAGEAGAVGPGRPSQGRGLRRLTAPSRSDRKSTRLNSSHGYISYAVFCLKKKKKTQLKCMTQVNVRT